MPATPLRLLSSTELAAWRGFLRTHSELLRELDAELRRAHDLPLTSYEVLLFLADAPEGRLRMSELADAVLLSRSGMSRLVDRLEAKGLLRREECEDDARGAFAVLSEPGRELFDAARATHLAGVREHFLDRLSRQELERLGRLWEQVLPRPAS
jgi:DNA-binding MarR family transcriptional regulator